MSQTRQCNRQRKNPTPDSIPMSAESLCVPLFYTSTSPPLPHEIHRPSKNLPPLHLLMLAQPALRELRPAMPAPRRMPDL